MADNVPITAGTGTDVATDDVAGVHYQKVKLDGGGDGATSPITGDTANGLDVDVTRLPALVAGSANIGDVDIASAPTGASAIQIQGPGAVDAAVVGNPVMMGGRSSDAIVTPVSADGEAVSLWVTRRGAQIVAPVSHIPLDGAPYTLTSKTAQYSTQQTGIALWTPAAGKKLVITSIQIQTGGTTAGALQVWFGASADTTYTRGTDLAIFDGEFAPSSTNKPGFAMTGLWIASAVDHILRVTDSAAINPLTVTVWGYEI
jgi:hypothetical protein